MNGDLSRDPVAQVGYQVVPGCVDADGIAALLDLVAPVLGQAADRGGVRHAIARVPGLERVVTGMLRDLVVPILGPDAFAVRVLLFDKTPLANWKATWHQDVTIGVTDYRETPGWGPWSRKDGGWHVRPPAAVLEGMLTARLHLDPCGATNGPVRVVPGSHRHGRLGDADVDRVARTAPPVDCLVPAGGVLLLRPLLLHSSAPAAAPSHRRVIHAEFAAAPLPDGFEWAERHPPA
ncbi:MAG: phytanoyl-CoA dioxygenase family protein [Gemmatimonadales bacterium]